MGEARRRKLAGDTTFKGPVPKGDPWLCRVRITPRKPKRFKRRGEPETELEKRYLEKEL